MYTLRGNSIAHYVAYHDVYALARQLGILPAPGSWGEKAFVAMQRLRTRLSNWRH